VFLQELSSQLKRERNKSHKKGMKVNQASDFLEGAREKEKKPATALAIVQMPSPQTFEGKNR
jgi:hypothetical protein